MSCRDFTLEIWRNGVPFKHPRNDWGCAGTVHQYTAVTTLESPVRLEWSLDGIPPLHPLLSTEAVFNYTFDNKAHELRLVATNATCSIGIGINVRGRDCPACPIACKQESVLIPAGEIRSIKDSQGTEYYLSGLLLGCSKGAGNDNTCRALEEKIQQILGCAADSLKVQIQYNKGNSKCLTLVIKNSPVRFADIKIGNSTFAFSPCQP